MEDSTIFGISLISFLLSLLILNYIIKVSVKAALHSTEYYLKGLLRAKMKEMIKQGYTKDEIHKMMDDSPEDFWNTL